MCSTSNGQLSTSGGNEVKLNPAVQGLHAEIIETLHKREYNQSFASPTNDGDRFRLMFPNHSASEHYHCSSTKSLYLLFEDVKNDMTDVPYTVKFDESTTSEVKKQLDIYVCYLSKIHDQVVNGYGGSCLIGHCTADDLLRHVQELLKSLNLRWCFT